MKKVLFVASITRHIIAFHIPYLKLFKENGYEVHVASKGEEKIEYCDKHFNIEFERSPLNKNNKKVYSELKKLINDNEYEVIHCHTPTASVLTRLAAKKARKNGTKVIYTAHGFHFYKGASIKNWILFYPIEWYLAKYVDTLVLINQEDYNLAKRHFSKRAINIEYIPGIGVDENKYCFNMSVEDKEKIRKSLNIENDKFVIIYPARLCKDKNQMLLLQLMKKINDSNVVLVLPGNDEYNGFYQKYVNENNISNVLFIGDRYDIPQLLKASDLLIASSIREGFGINLVEALACGVPVIAVDNRGHREIVQDGINGFLIKNDIDELVDKFDKLYNDKELYEKMKEKCYDTSKQFFLSHSIEIMKKIYELR